MTYQVPEILPTHIFRTYDIRGEVGEGQLTEDVAYAIGLAVGSEAQAQRQQEVVVARDTRLSGADMKKALIAGITDSGCDVVDIGMGPTPLVYFATHYLPTQTGVMVTASHNPSNHNGFKIVMNGCTLSMEGVQEILVRIRTRDFSQGHGHVREEDITPIYIDTVCRKLRLAKSMKVVVDAGNGAASEIAPAVLRRLGCDVVPLFCEFDGHFPNHHPDPTVPKNLTSLIEKVKAEKADIGLAFDGDADRLGVVTDQGEIIWPDRQLMIFAKEVLQYHRGEKVIFDVKCSRVLPLIIKQNGGKPVMFRTGHSLVKAKMLEENAPLAGEMSGHIFFQDNWYGFDDGIYVGARLLSILSRENKTVSEVFAALPQTVNTSELKLPLAEERKADFMKRLLADAVFPDAEKITIDGLRVEWHYGWGLVRPSNTSPYLILRFEADTSENLEKIKAVFREQLLMLDKGLALPF